MREAANKLRNMGRINLEIRLAVTMAGAQSPRLAELRADYAFEATQLQNQLTARLASHYEAQLASRLLDEFILMRRFLVRHQHRWTTAEVTRDPAGYVAEAVKITVRVASFVEDTLSAISAAMPPPSCAFAPAGDLRLTGTR